MVSWDFSHIPSWHIGTSLMLLWAGRWHVGENAHHTCFLTDLGRSDPEVSSSDCPWFLRLWLQWQTGKQQWGRPQWRVGWVWMQVRLWWCHAVSLALSLATTSVFHIWASQHCGVPSSAPGTPEPQNQSVVSWLRRYCCSGAVIQVRPDFCLWHRCQELKMMGNQIIWGS